MTFIPQVWPEITEREVTALVEYLRSGGWLTEFDRTEEFEQRIARFLGVKHAIVVPNGTAALYLSLLGLGIGPGDSVLVPDYTMIASPNAVRWANAEVVLCDIAPDTLCMDLARVELKQNTRALMYVPVNGRAGNMEEVVDFCRRHNLRLIEDACQAFASRSKGQFLGTFGDVAALSFTPHKLITTGQGGAVITNDSSVFDKVKKLKDFCRVRPGVDQHTDVGYNFKFTDLQAVIGIEQIKTIGSRVDRKRALYQAYREQLSSLPEIEMLPIDLTQAVPWFVDVLVPAARRDALMAHLKACGVGSRPFYPPIHTQAPYGTSEGSFAVTSDVAPRGLWLPSSLQLRIDQVQDIARHLRSFFA